MTNQEPVTLAAFKDMVDTHAKEGHQQMTIAALACIDGFSPEELRKAIHYAAQQNIELVFIPDYYNDVEADYNPIDDPIERATELFANPIDNHD